MDASAHSHLEEQAASTSELISPPGCRWSPPHRFNFKPKKGTSWREVSFENYWSWSYYWDALALFPEWERMQHQRPISCLAARFANRIQRFQSAGTAVSRVVV